MAAGRQAARKGELLREPQAFNPVAANICGSIGLNSGVFREFGARLMSDHNNWNALQDSYLNDLRKRRMSVLVYLVNGIRQHGHIESFDMHTILLTTGSTSVLVYKHAIATVLPAPKALAEVKASSAPVRTDAPTSPAAAPVIIRKATPRRIVSGTEDRAEEQQGAGLTRRKIGVGRGSSGS